MSNEYCLPIRLKLPTNHHMLMIGLLLCMHTAAAAVTFAYLYDTLQLVVSLLIFLSALSSMYQSVVEVKIARIDIDLKNIIRLEVWNKDVNYCQEVRFETAWFCNFGALMVLSTRNRLFRLWCWRKQNSANWHRLRVWLRNPVKD